MSRGRTGFTLVELTVALAIVVVVAGIVVVRVDGWSPTQKLRAGARALGNSIRYYREDAQLNESLYAVRIDREEGTYEILSLLERSMFGKPKRISMTKLGQGMSFGKILIGEVEMESPFTMVLGPRGILPEIAIEIENADSEKVTLTLGGLVNQVIYDEAHEEERLEE